jgi:hypothetical protein
MMSPYWIIPITLVTLLFVWMHGFLSCRQSKALVAHSAITLLWIAILFQQILKLLK